MIYGSRTVWISDTHPHRIIRRAASGLSPYRKGLEELNWSKDSNTPTISHYLISAESFLTELTNVYDSAFGESYRRRSESLALRVSPKLQITANTKASDKNSNLCPVYLDFGVLLAVEDAAHALLSDPHTPLGYNDIERTSDDRNVFRLPDHKLFDHYRYVDYTPVIEGIELSGVGADYKLFSSYLFKFLSGSSYRQEIADMIATMTLMWILCHEDAHNYHGHLLYFSVLGSSSDSIPFSEFIAGTSFFDEQTRLARKACEIEADTSACARMVDHIVDSELIDMLPVLKAHQRVLGEGLSSDLENEYSSEQIAFILLVRVCIISELLAVAIFERNVIKKNADTSFYPNFIERILNIITTSIFRATDSAYRNRNYGIEPLTPGQLAVLVVLIVNDLEAIVRNVLRAGLIIRDPQMDASEENFQNIKILEDDEFKVQLIHSVIWTLYGRDTRYKTDISKYGDLFYSFMRTRVKDMRICRDVFFDYRMKANPKRQAKVLESADLESAAISSLERRLNL